MAVPTITTITPASVASTSRAMVRIDGTGFNYWTSLPAPNAGMRATVNMPAWVTATAYTAETRVKEGGNTYRCTVAHTSAAATRPGVGASWSTVWHLVGACPFADTACTVHVCSATLAFVVVPEYVERGPAVVTLTLQNLDAAGVPVTGETASKTYTYSSEAFIAPDEEPFAVQVLKALVQRLEAHFNITVAITTDVDYTEDGELARVIATPPAVLLTDFTLDKSMTNVDQVIASERRYRDTMFFTMRGAFLIVAKKFSDALTYLAALQMFAQRCPFYVVKGIKVKLRLDSKAVLGLNITEGVKTWSIGWELDPIAVECPEEIDIAFKALTKHVETYELT